MEIRSPGACMRYSHLRNVISFEGVCEICDQLVTLKSCDAVVFFAPFSVPLVPLGRERIVDLCPSCGRYRAMTRRSFLDQRDTDYAEVARLLEDRWFDELSALDALRLACTYREPLMVHRVITRVADALPQSPEAQLFIAETHRLMGEFVRAEEATRRSLRLRENDEVRESLAEFQFNRSNIESGRATLAPLLAARSMVPLRAIKAGVLALQRVGRHAEVLALLAKAGAGYRAGDLADEFAALREPSERALAASKKTQAVDDPFAFGGVELRQTPQPAYWL